MSGPKPRKNKPRKAEKLDALPIISNLAFALHLPLDACWDFTFPEYYAVLDAVTPEKEKFKETDDDFFEPEEIEALASIKKRLKKTKPP